MPTVALSGTSARARSASFGAPVWGYDLLGEADRQRSAWAVPSYLAYPKALTGEADRHRTAVAFLSVYLATANTTLAGQADRTRTATGILASTVPMTGTAARHRGTLSPVLTSQASGQGSGPATYNFSVVASLTVAFNGSTTAPTYDDMTVNGEYNYFILSGSATLTDVVPQVPVQNRPRLSVTLSLPAPVLVKGIPLLPPYRFDASAALTSARTMHVLPPPKPKVDAPPTPTHSTHGPATQSYRWLAQDVPTSDGVYTNSWAEHSGAGPSWYSFFPYRPRPFAHDDIDGVGTIWSTPRVLHFWRRYIEHMWLTLDAPQPYTWMIAGILHGISSPQYVLDCGTNHPPHLSVDQTATLGTEFANRSLMMFQDKVMKQASDNSHIVASHFAYVQKPMVYTGVFNGSKSFMRVDGRGMKQRLHGNAGTHKGKYFVLGRGQGFLSPSHATHMSLFEVRFWNTDLTDSDIDDQVAHMEGAYNFRAYP